jgi:hypothetical protein
MVDEQEPAKRVVKRVVKKTVVRPAAASAPKPQVRYGRPVATAAKPQAKVASRNVRPAPAAKTSHPTTPRAKPAPRTRPRLQIGAQAGAAGHRVADAWWVVADGVRDGAGAAGRFAAARTRAAASYRLPHINLYLASVITGAVTGMFSVAASLVALRIFESTRGVAGGGGLWGSVTFVVVALLAYVLGALLLQGFGSRSARLTSFLGVVLAIVAILGLFLGLADGAAGLVLVPLLGLVTFAIAHWLIDLAENTPAIVE